MEIKKPENISEWLKLGYTALVVSTIAVAGLGVTKIGYEKISKPKTARISLVYENASKGLNPDGTRLDPYQVVSEQTLEKAEEKLGKKIDRTTVWIRPTTTANNTEYATDYTLYYKGHSKKVLNAILDAWAENFNEKRNLSQVDYAEADESIDYLDMSYWLENETNEILSYAKMRVKENNKWVSEDGVSFKDILDAAQNVVDVDIANYKTYVIQNGITSDVDKLRSALEYRDKLLSDKKAIYEAQYNNRKKAIELYDPTLFPTISVPSISGGVYYVTTTKTGLDDIYDEAASYSSMSLDTQKMLTDDKLMSQNMKTTSTKEQQSLADTMQNSVIKKIKALAEQLKAVDDEYVETEEKPYFVIK